MKKELKYINQKNSKLLIKLLEAETASGKEYLITPLLVEELEKRNFTVSVDDINNVCAIRGEAQASKDGKCIMLNAHTDIRDIGDNWWNTEYFSDYLKNKKEYPNTYSLYSDIYDEIVFTRDEANMKGLCHTSLILSVIESYLNELTHKDYSNMGYDCYDCKHGCKQSNMCENFELEKLEKGEDLSFLERFIDTLEDYAYEATEELHRETINTSKEEDYEVVLDMVNDRIYGRGKKRVLGGDDKAGIFIALMVAELLPDVPMKILFTVQEETGCIGVKHFIKNNQEFFKDVRYSLTIDRKGGRDLLWSQCGKRSCDKSFAARAARYGANAGINVKVTDGNVADVIYIRDLVPNSINMSAGYYNPHTSEEYIVPSEVDKIIGWVKGIIENI